MRLAEPRRTVRFNFVNVIELESQAHGDILRVYIQALAPSDHMTEPSSQTSANSSRLLSLDVFRGLTILAMILVNNPGEWGRKFNTGRSSMPRGMAGRPPTSSFPSSCSSSARRLPIRYGDIETATEIEPAVYWRIVRRTALLIFLGWMPTLLLKTIATIQGEPFDLSNLRIYGVLVRIALVYFFTSLIVLHIPVRGASGARRFSALGLLGAAHLAPRT